MSYDGLSHLRVAIDSDHAELLAAGIVQATGRRAYMIKHAREGAEPLWVASSDTAGSGLPVLEVLPLFPGDVAEVLAWHAERLAKANPSA